MVFKFLLKIFKNKKNDTQKALLLINKKKVKRVIFEKF